jgi:hypothetical protein
MLSVAFVIFPLNVIILSVVMLNVIMLSVIILSVMAPVEMVGIDDYSINCLIKSFIADASSVDVKKLLLILMTC